eukprot:5938580-Pyramimonas_sp.AAC.1
MRQLAGLRIQISRCALVPLVGKITATLRTMAQAQLAHISSECGGPIDRGVHAASRHDSGPRGYDRH